MSGQFAETVQVCHPGQCCDGWCVEVASIEVHQLADRDTAISVGESLMLAVTSARTETHDLYRNLLDEYAVSVTPAPYTSERALFERLWHVAFPPDLPTTPPGPNPSGDEKEASDAGRE